MVSKRNKKWWVDFRYKGKRYRKMSPINTKEAALHLERQIKEDLLHGRNKNRKMKLSDYLDYWYKTYAEPNNKPTTLRSKRMVIDKHLSPLLGRIQLDELTFHDVEIFKAKKLKEDLSPKTVNNHLSVLLTALRIAHEWEYIDRVPRIHWLKEPETHIRFLSEEECCALLTASQGSLVSEMILCGLRTGMRRGELLGLEWPSINFKRRQISVRQAMIEGEVSSTKNNRIRHIPIANDLFDVLFQRRRVNGFVFSPESGTPIRETTANKWLNKACKKAGVKPMGWHTLRHTFASHLTIKGVPIRMVQTLLGHSTIQMTERYSHLAPSHLDQAITVLEPGNQYKIGTFGHHMVIAPNQEKAEVLEIASNLANSKEKTPL